MSTAETDDNSQGNALSLAVIKLLKGVIYQDDDPGLWQQIMNLQPCIRDYVAVMGLTFQIDESEGYAWLATQENDQDTTPLPRLMNRRQLSFPVSLLIALLRRKLAEADTTGGELRLILDRDEVVNLMRTFLPESSNEVRLVDQIDSHLNKVAELGFIRRLRDQKDKIEVRRIIKAFVDAQWLNEFDQRLQDYQHHFAPGSDPSQNSEDNG